MPPFRDQPEVREAFFHGLAASIKFRQGLYSYKGPWKGALPWLRERLMSRQAKSSSRVEEMVSPGGLF
jgi:hypothetical protein